MIGAQECSTSYGLEPIPWHRCGQRAFRAPSGLRTRHAASRRRANAASSTDGAIFMPEVEKCLHAVDHLACSISASNRPATCTRMQSRGANACAGAGSIETASAEAGNTAHDPRAQGKARRFASSWDAKEASAEAGSKEDYLSNLGTAQDYNINVSHGAPQS